MSVSDRNGDDQTPPPVDIAAGIGVLLMFAVIIGSIVCPAGGLR